MILTIITWFAIVLNFANALLVFGLLFNEDYRKEHNIVADVFNILYSILLVVLLVLLS